MSTNLDHAPRAGKREQPETAELLLEFDRGDTERIRIQRECYRGRQRTRRTYLTTLPAAASVSRGREGSDERK